VVSQEYRLEENKNMYPDLRFTIMEKRNLNTIYVRNGSFKGL